MLVRRSGWLVAVLAVYRMAMAAATAAQAFHRFINSLNSPTYPVSARLGTDNDLCSTFMRYGKTDK